MKCKSYKPWKGGKFHTEVGRYRLKSYFSPITLAKVQEISNGLCDLCMRKRRHTFLADYIVTSLGEQCDIKMKCVSSWYSRPTSENTSPSTFAEMLRLHLNKIICAALFVIGRNLRRGDYSLIRIKLNK